MSFRYAVLGAGRQGVAAAYDMAKFGDADEIVLADVNGAAAESGARRVNKLLDTKVARAVKADLGNKSRLQSILRGTDSLLSALPYKFNLAVTDAAIRVKSHMTDLGGNTAIVRKQLGKSALAKKAGITVVPDCGMGPGMNISLAVYAMSLLDKTREILIWDGGLPQNPQPPWNYLSTFAMGGLVNEYYGSAYFLRNGKITEIPCFDGYELLDFPKPIGRLEAFVTSGGLSTMPWTFEGKLERLENKTLRYPGHVAQFKAFRDLGLYETEPVKVGNVKITPRDVFGALLVPKITRPDVRDVCVMRVKCVGKKNGKEASAIIELIDYYDEKTGFTGMQRLTGWHASIVAILAAFGKTPKGAVSIERAVPGKMIVDEARKRGFNIQERIEYLG